MNTPEAAKLLAILASEYPRETIDETRVAVWSGVLADIPLAGCLRAVATWLSDPEKSRFFPHPGEFAELAGAKAVRAAHYHRYAELRSADALSADEEAEFRRLDAALFGAAAYAGAMPAAIGAGR